MTVGDKVLIDSPVNDSPFKGKEGYITEKIGRGFLLHVPKFGDYFTTERWLTVVEEAK